MENILVAIYDQVMKFYQYVNVQVNKGVAIRWFQDDICSKEGPVKNHPSDYSLVMLGTINVNTGEIKPCVEKIIEATDCCPVSNDSKA